MIAEVLGRATEAQKASPRAEAFVALAYFAVYMAYHFLTREGELLHWVSLVLIPLAGLTIMRRFAGAERPLRDALGSMGLRRRHLSTGLGWAILAGLLASAVNLAGPQRGAIIDLMRSGEALYLYPLAILLMLTLAATTEEVFFRGVLQTRLTRLLGSALAAIVFTSILFSIYHLPFAYFNPNWPSAGNWTAALQAAFGNGLLGGVVLGGVFVLARHNLLAPILAHAMVNAFPGMVMLDRML